MHSPMFTTKKYHVEFTGKKVYVDSLANGVTRAMGMVKYVHKAIVLKG